MAKVRSYLGCLLKTGIVCSAILTIWQLHLIFLLDVNRTVVSYQNEIKETNRCNNNSGRSSNRSKSGDSSWSNNSNKSGSSSSSSSSSNNSIVVSWPEKQQSRKDQVQKACQSFQKMQELIEIQKRSQSRTRNGKWKATTPEEELTRIAHSRQAISNLYVDDVYKIIYCNVPNVSSAQWKKVMILLSDSKFRSADDIGHITTHVTNNLTKLSLKKYSPKAVSFRLKTFSKILTIRDPLDRLLSAYRNKFAKDAPLSSLYHNMYGRNWIPMVRRDSNHTGILQFEEMLEFLSRHSGPTEKFNNHWKPIFDICHPCIIQYDFIANFTTQEQDSNEILVRVLQGSQNSGLRFPEAERSSAGDRLQELSTTLDPELVRDVQKKYYKDYAMFGYHRFTT